MASGMAQPHLVLAQLKLPQAVHAGTTPTGGVAHFHTKRQKTTALKDKHGNARVSSETNSRHR